MSLRSMLYQSFFGLGTIIVLGGVSYVYATAENPSELVSEVSSETLTEASSELVSEVFAGEKFTSNKCSRGKTMRVAVVQGGAYADFIKVFRQMVLSLSADKYIETNNLVHADFNYAEGDNYLKLAQASQGSCIELIEDGLYDGKWDVTLTSSLFSALKERIRLQKDVDLVWAFGTIAGKAFADSSLGVPVMVITPTDAESAGIIGVGEFSNLPNVHVQKEKDRYYSELKMFHDIFKFKNLGVILDEDPENQRSQGQSIIQDLASERQFKVTQCTGDVFKEGAQNTQETLQRCALELAQTCDAVYIPVGNAINENTAKNIKPLLDKGIPTFSQTGESEVQYGVLLSMSDNSMQGAGIFEANVVKQIYQGVPPEKISQYYFASLFLALNLESAKIIGWDPSFELLIAVDKVYPTIKYQDATTN